MRGGKNITIFLSSLPVPKSNRYVRKKNGRVFRPPQVLHWEARALWEIRRQYDGESLKKPLAVEVYFFLPDRRKRDIDNMLKTLWDVLEKAGVVENDNLIQETRTVKVYDGDTHGTVVIIKPFRRRRQTFEKMKMALTRFKISISR
jgi:crossover junction endodeoxyribonuclease RusA